MLDRFRYPGHSLLVAPSVAVLAVNPKVIGRWALQLAAAGARDRGVFEAAAAACLLAVARGVATKAAGSSKGTKGWPILAATAPVIYVNLVLTMFC